MKTLKTSITAVTLNDALQAARGKDPLLTSLLRVLIGEIQLTESKKGALSEKAVIKQIKKLKNSCDDMAKYGCNTAAIESKILESYLPKPLSIDEIQCIIVASPLYQEILDSDNPMKLTRNASALLDETGKDYNGKDVSDVMRTFKSK